MFASNRRLLILIALLSFAAVGVALISQYVFDMQPCAYCVLQRLIYLAVGVVCLLTALGGGVLRRLGALLGLALAACGVWAAYYQYTVASKLLSCAQTFADRFIASLGLDTLLPQVFGAYATCAEAVVKVLGVEYALWSLALFVVLALLSLAALFKRA
jgi:protein dithiol:quinone oxidoreductase